MKGELSEREIDQIKMRKVREGKTEKERKTW